MQILDNYDINWIWMIIKIKEYENYMNREDPIKRSDYNCSLYRQYVPPELINRKNNVW